MRCALLKVIPSEASPALAGGLDCLADFLALQVLTVDPQ